MGLIWVDKKTGKMLWDVGSYSNFGDFRVLLFSYISGCILKKKEVLEVLDDERYVRELCNRYGIYGESVEHFLQHSDCDGETDLVYCEMFLGFLIKYRDRIFNWIMVNNYKDQDSRVNFLFENILKGLESCLSDRESKIIEWS